MFCVFIDAKVGNVGGATSKTATGKLKMQLDEACKILNLDIKSESESAIKQLAAERYARMSAANDPAKGGSFYLHSKVFRAKETIDYHFKQGKSSTDTPNNETTESANNQKSAE